MIAASALNGGQALSPFSSAVLAEHFPPSWLPLTYHSFETRGPRAQDALLCHLDDTCFLVPCPGRDPRRKVCHLPLLPPPAICPLAEAGRPVLKEWLSPGRGVTPEASVWRCGGLLQGWLVGYQVAEPLTWLSKNQDSRLHATRLRAVWTLGPNTVCL